VISEKASEVSPLSERKLWDNPGILTFCPIIRKSPGNSTSDFDPNQFTGFQRGGGTTSEALMALWRRISGHF
jgi:hypothetical protein